MSDAPPLRRTYKYRLYPTAAQERRLEHQLGLCADLYNAALEQRRLAGGSGSSRPARVRGGR